MAEKYRREKATKAIFLIVGGNKETKDEIYYLLVKFYECPVS